MASARVTIRPLKRGDYKRIREIEKASVDEYLQYLKETRETDTVAPSVRPAYFRHYLKKGSSFVAEVDQRITGYILSQPTSFLHSSRKELWLEYIVVLSEFRRKGIGSMLLAEVTRWSRERNFDLLHTNLNPNNPESARLFVKHGYEVRNWKTAHRILK